MKTAIPVLTMVLLFFAACGGGGAANNMPPGNAGGADTPEPSDPFDRDANVGLHAKWLVIEARKASGKYTLHMDGKAASTDAVRKRLSDYAAEVDRSAHMPGSDASGISANPVVFRAPPDAPSVLFGQVIELMASAMAYRFVVELKPAGGPARSIWQQLPVDDGLDMPPPPEDIPEGPVEFPSDDDMLPDTADMLLGQVRNQLTLYCTPQDEGKYQYVLGAGSGGRSPVEGTSYSMSDMLKGGWNDALYLKTRRSLAESLISRRKEADSVEVAFAINATEGASSGTVPWVTTFLAIDAVRVANTAPPKGERSAFFTTFKFADSLGRFND
jgi:hypothetical protein